MSVDKEMHACGRQAPGNLSWRRRGLIEDQAHRRAKTDVRRMRDHWRGFTLTVAMLTRAS